MSMFAQPGESSGEILAVEALENPIVQRGVGHWRRMKGSSAFPPRSLITPRLLGSVIANVILVRVLEDDYEYRIVGDALIQGFGESFAGKRLSAVIESDPKFGSGLKLLYDQVRISGAPLGYRGWVGEDMRGAKFVYHESAILPFGPPDGAVDHLLVVSAITLRKALAG